MIIKELSKEYEKLLTKKKNLYSDSRKKKKIQEILTLKSNVDRLLYPPQKEQPETENERYPFFRSSSTGCVKKTESFSFGGSGPDHQQTKKPSVYRSVFLAGNVLPKDFQIK